MFSFTKIKIQIIKFLKSCCVYICILLLLNVLFPLLKSSLKQDIDLRLIKIGCSSAYATPQKEQRTKKVRKGKKKRRKNKKKRRKGKRTVTVPVELAIGPSAFMFSGPIQRAEPFISGINLSLEAIISRELIRQNKKKIPKKYRRYAKNLNEVRLRPFPLPLIPTELVLSPSSNVAVYGASWSILGLSTRLGPIRLGARLHASLLSIRANQALAEEGRPTELFFARPGVRFQASVPIQLSQGLGLAAGWRSALYIPQPLNGSVAELGRFDDQSLWHIGQLYLSILVRFPYTTRI